MIIVKIVNDKWLLFSNRAKMFYNKGLLKSFVKPTGKHLCQSLFCNEAADRRSANSLKMDLREVPLRAFRKNFKNTFFAEHLLATTSAFSF